MSAATEATLARFGGVEDGHRYTDLVELFADDAVYYDPFYGPQVGRDAIAEFMGHMEQAVPASGATFAEWNVEADEHVGWATWFMVARHRDGHDVAVPGESLYRLREGLVTGVVDYVDPVAYNKLRGDAARTPDYASAAGATVEVTSPGPAAGAIREHVDSMRRVGRWAGTATLIDCDGGDDVGWAQWTFHGPHGAFCGWSLRHRDGSIRDLFDTVGAAELKPDGVR